MMRNNGSKLPFEIEIAKSCNSSSSSSSLAEASSKHSKSLQTKTTTTTTRTMKTMEEEEESSFRSRSSTSTSSLGNQSAKICNQDTIGSLRSPLVTTILSTSSSGGSASSPSSQNPSVVSPPSPPATSGPSIIELQSAQLSAKRIMVPEMGPLATAMSSQQPANLARLRLEAQTKKSSSLSSSSSKTLISSSKSSSSTSSSSSSSTLRGSTSSTSSSSQQVSGSMTADSSDGTREHHEQHQQQQCSSSESSRQYKSCASLYFAGDRADQVHDRVKGDEDGDNRDSKDSDTDNDIDDEEDDDGKMLAPRQQTPPSPADFRSLAEQIGTEFAQLQSALESTTTTRRMMVSSSSSSSSMSKTSSTMMSSSPFTFGQQSLLSQSSLSSLLSNKRCSTTTGATGNRHHLYLGSQARRLEPLSSEPSCIESSPSPKPLELEWNSSSGNKSAQEPEASSPNSQKIKMLMDKAAQRKLYDEAAGSSPSAAKPVNATTAIAHHKPQQANKTTNDAMSESIERIDQRMNNLGKKLAASDRLVPAIELLQVMVGMLSKAWSVPVCGDDLGFRLCNSLRQSGGLDFALGLIDDAYGYFGGDWSLLIAPLLSPKEFDVETTQASEHEKVPLWLLQTSTESADDRKPNDYELKLRAELVLLAAQLVSQSLTSDNRGHLVDRPLEAPVGLACALVLHKRPIKVPVDDDINRKEPLDRIESNNQDHSEDDNDDKDEASIKSDDNEDETRRSTTANKARVSDAKRHSKLQLAPLHEPKVVPLISEEELAAIGTEILQHLFKHSDDTCSAMIAVGALEAVLFACRSSSLPVLRHCASGLANLALYGGPDSQQSMIEQKAHVWLFPLAFNKDDHVQYYACLAIVVLLANRQIEAEVLKSSTLNLVEPFVTSHEPRKFAESTVAHIHGQSASWLKRLLPLLDSGARVEAKNLAAFHFAMEAHIKREQGRCDVFKSIGAVEPLQRLGSSPNAIASRFACQALRLMGEREPHKLSQQVPLWSATDVCEWVSQVGFSAFREKFRESRVDGDLLLQLDELMLQQDIGIANGIIRRRFLRELAKLKRLADYSSLDPTGLCQLLGPDNVEYAYAMLRFGVTRNNIHQLDGDQLIAECRVANSIQRLRLGQAIRSLQERVTMQLLNEAAEMSTTREQMSCGSPTHSVGSSHNGGPMGMMHGHHHLNLNHPHSHHLNMMIGHRPLDVFVSYRRATGSQLASLLKVHLQLRGFSVFIDVERLEAGKFDMKLLDSIRASRNFILVLSPNALDRCVGDSDCRDWVHREIVCALGSQCNIIPVFDSQFQWPEPEQLPDDMRTIASFNGVRWIHDYQDACVDKIERFIRGELTNGAESMSVASGGGATGGGYGGGAGGSAICGSSSGGNQTSGARQHQFNHGTPPSSGAPHHPHQQHHHHQHHHNNNNNGNHHIQQQQQPGALGSQCSSGRSSLTRLTAGSSTPSGSHVMLMQSIGQHPLTLASIRSQSQSCD